MSKAYKNYFPLPNAIFSLNLSPGEIAVYSYLLYCEDRKTYQCYPSYKTIGRAVGMSINTVQKYIAALGEKGFIILRAPASSPNPVKSAMEPFAIPSTPFRKR